MKTEHKIIKGSERYPFKTREELMSEDTIYPPGQFIQVKGENARYVADGRKHFKDLSKWMDFPDDKEMGWNGFEWLVYDRK